MSSGAYELNHECASMSDFITHTRMCTHIFYRNKHGYRCFIFILTQPYLSNVNTSFLESLCWQDVVWLTVPWDPTKISSRRLLN